MATDKQSAEKEYTVEEKLSTLYQLQTMMTEIDKIKTLRGELPLEVQDLEDEIAGLETRLQNYQAEIKEFEASVVEQKHKITESTTLIDRYKAQLCVITGSLITCPRRSSSKVWKLSSQRRKSVSSERR